MEIKCTCPPIHEDLIKEVKRNMEKEETLYDTAELFKVFGDTTRIKIISALLNNEMCVCDIAHVINMTHSAVSHQLRILKQSRLVKASKKGKSVYYSLNDNHIKELLNIATIHIKEKE